MTTAGLILACLAAAIHIYIFYLESVAWTRPKTRAIFGVSSAAEAETTRRIRRGPATAQPRERSGGGIYFRWESNQSSMTSGCSPK